MTRRRTLTRRAFLRGLGGVAVALPILGHGLGRDLLAAEAGGATTAGGFPKRFIYFYHPNGTMQDVFWPTPGAGERDFGLSPILAPLEPFRQKLLVMKGLEMTSGASDAGPGGPHQRGMGTLLTGRPLQQGEFVGGDGSLAGWGSGISIDQAIANHIGGTTRRKSLQLGVRADTSSPTADVRTRISYAGAAQPLPPQNDPLAVFDYLFSDFDTDPSALNETRLKRKSVLDAVGDQFELVHRRAGHADRMRLEAHLAMVRDLEIRLENEHVTGEACYIPMQPEAMAPDSEDTMPDIARLQIDLMVMALACDLTRVASLQFSNSFNHIRFPWLESLGDGHQLSHAGPSNNDAKTQWTARDTWFADQFAYLLMKLDAIPEGDGTMLDHTAVLWINELSQGNTHSHVDMPFVLAGSAGGFFDTGRFVDFGGTSHARLLASLQNAFGVEEEIFGDPRFCSGPLASMTR